MGAHMRAVSALGDDTRLGPLRAIGVELVAAVSFVVVVALAAVEAGVGLGADADALAGLDESDFWADAESCADDFCSRVSLV